MGLLMVICRAMCAQMEVDYQELIAFASQAPKMYKVYAIPKRTSGKRIIAHPAKALKAHQKALLVPMADIFSVHHCAYAYKKGTSIKCNARQHQDSHYLLKMDFQNFFNSITVELFALMLVKLNIEISPEDQSLIEHLAFWCPSKKTDGKRILSVGAPSSPFISNWIMSGFDEVVYQLCQQENIVYTRYADDLTFSTRQKNSLFKLPKQIKMLLRAQFNGLIVINDTKTISTSKKHNRHVTGITLTNEGNLSIGRERKRYISLLLHKFSINQLDSEDIGHLSGLLSFANHIEPGFKDKMAKKYSQSIINQVIDLQRNA
jgi:RNA-directed DNA polymerase